MNLLGNKIDKLAKTSQNIISVFTNTIDELTKVNSEISIESDSKMQEIVTLTKEVETLDTLKQSNDKIISKVKQIIE